MVPPFFLLLTGGFAALLYAAIRYLRVRRVFAVGLPA